MCFPRVLIYGQPFNNFSGGGITLTNLFKGWTIDKIAVAYIGHGLLNVTTDICNTYYQLGADEHKWVFPFNLIQRKFPSGLKSIDQKKEGPINYIQKGLRYRLVNEYFYPFLRWLGLFYIASGISISKKLKEWLNEYQPQVLYLQVSNREDVLFAKDLHDLLKIPAVIHIMDDWPSTVSKKGLFKKYWSGKTDREFRELLNRVDLHLSISDAMSVEYMKRYNKHFVPFHNPIETDTWLPYTKSNFVLNKDYITILYSGRIGIGITESLFEVASALDSINKDGLNTKLHIQTPSKESGILSQLQKYECVIINPFASLEQLPEIFSEADMLLLANDFGAKGFDYLRFSMPTKASEYMISGTPVLVYSPEETAVSEFFRQNECGFCVTKQEKNGLVSAIKYLINNEEYRKKISRNAVNIAIHRFNAKNVRKEFQGILINLGKDIFKKMNPDTI